MSDVSYRWISCLNFVCRAGWWFRQCLPRLANKSRKSFQKITGGKGRRWLSPRLSSECLCVEPVTVVNWLGASLHITRAELRKALLTDVMWICKMRAIPHVILNAPLTCMTDTESVGLKDLIFSREGLYHGLQLNWDNLVWQLWLIKQKY
jgi:hypothetical protein